jgi:hypothetical protein
MQTVENSPWKRLQNTEWSKFEIVFSKTSGTEKDVVVHTQQACVRIYTGAAGRLEFQPTWAKGGIH